jgi:small subunit ribosomal protein S3
MATREKQKAAARAENKDKRPKAFVRHIRMSPFKVRSIIDLVRGKTYNDAVAILANTPASASEPIRKVLNSAAANAEFQNMSKKDLYVAEIFADPGPTMKRIMARGKGSADRILKRTSHITVILERGQIMGQKVNPHGLRVGIIEGWNTQWYADKKAFSKNLLEDHKIRTLLKKKYNAAGISKITIERAAQTITVNIFCGRPGVAIGKAAEGVLNMKKEVEKIAKGLTVNVNVLEVKRVDSDSQLVAEGIAAQLEKRIQFRRAMKQAMQRTMKTGVKGIKVMVGGRLDGAEIARSEHYHEGSIPLQTLRADIDYGFAEAHTTYGVIGVKVWIYKGEVFNKNLAINKAE